MLFSPAQRARISRSRVSRLLVLRDGSRCQASIRFFRALVVVAPALGGGQVQLAQCEVEVVDDLLVGIALVPLEGEDVVASLPNNLVDDSGLGSHRVNGHDVSLEIEHFEEPGKRRDFVGLVGHKLLGQSEPRIPRLPF